MVSIIGVVSEQIFIVSIIGFLFIEEMSDQDVDVEMEDDDSFVMMNVLLLKFF